MKSPLLSRELGHSLYAPSTLEKEICILPFETFICFWFFPFIPPHLRERPYVTRIWGRCALCHISLAETVVPRSPLLAIREDSVRVCGRSVSATIHLWRLVSGTNGCCSSQASSLMLWWDSSWAHSSSNSCQISPRHFSSGSRHFCSSTAKDSPSSAGYACHWFHVFQVVVYKLQFVLTLPCFICMFSSRLLALMTCHDFRLITRFRSNSLSKPSSPAPAIG